MLETAKTILEQLGGRKFIVMTGAKNFMGDANMLRFQLPSTAHYVKNGINVVRITLGANDLYTVEFIKVRGTKVTPVSTHDGIYFDGLQSLFTEHTGLRTSL
jgi:hypothetical protein